MDKKFFSKIGFNYLILGITALIFQVLVISLVSASNIPILTDSNITVILVAICNYVLPLPIFLYLMNKFESSEIEKESVDLKTFIKYIAITITLMLIGNLIGIILTTIIGGAIQSEISNPVENLINSTNIWLNLALISIIGPIFEEILFRKILIDKTIKYGARISIIISALLFGLFHGNVNQFFYAFLMGGFFAYVYIKTGKIIYPIILHLIVNLMGSVISLKLIQSISNLYSGSINLFDASFVIIYVIIILILVTIGLILLLTKFKTAKFKGSKTKINLKKPFKTSLINVGMICFIIFYLIQIISTLLS
ncbi:CPBP family intramembrane glutamic endopeptidase [Methanobrevibacter oralis]|uniref:CAAX amino terminal protease self-immunity n=1 Tax=Methanobrevibacter oralis TaxID=66851 RepID=A0A166BGG4_METOA|nr:CPBP family intramembrane glutamic endopeptidase [Methanobrevibacter oralis]KZX13314.1 CAAX amino terminal protease self- immunity [Methanobrevibacter oralis]